MFKVKKTRLQLAAYKLAAEACLGIKISKTQIIVSTPIDDYQTQVFTFGESEVEKDELAWLALVDKFFNEVRPKGRSVLNLCQIGVKTSDPRQMMGHQITSCNSFVP